MEVGKDTTVESVCHIGDFLVHRVWKTGWDQPVLLKTPAHPNPLPALFQQLDREFEVTRELDPQLIARPIALERQANTTALVLENWNCQTLDERIGTPMEIGRFLRIAIGIVKALA